MASSQNPVFLATAGYDHTIRFWETLSGVCYRTVQHQDSQVNKLVISPDKLSIVAAGNPHVRVYDVSSTSPTPEHTFSGHTGNVTRVYCDRVYCTMANIDDVKFVGFQEDYKWMYTGSEDGTVRIWDVRQPGCQRELEHGSMVETVTLNPNQVEIVSGDQEGRIRVWDLRANDCVEELIPEANAAMRSITVASDGSLMVASTNTGNIYVWSLRTNTHAKEAGLTEMRPLRQLGEQRGHQILKCSLNPDVTMLATCSADHTVALWNVNTWKQEKILVGHQRWVWDCAWSADSQYLVTASSDKTAKLWDVSKGEAIRQFAGHQKAIVCLALQDIPPK
eukprot:CFRG0196T1